MSLCRPPRAALRPFVELLWASDPGDPAERAPALRELVLPTGRMHMVFRLDDRPWRLFAGPDDRDGQRTSDSVLGGVRAGPYCKEIPAPVATVGAMLRPGAVEILSGAPAGVLAGRHTALEDLWPAAALTELRERLALAPGLEQRLVLLEEALAGRLPRVRGVDPLVAHALARFGAGARVDAVVAESGFSHRHLARSFHEGVGLTPKAWCRVRRFDRVVDRLTAGPGTVLAEIAAAEGYADQAHMSRDFRALAGITPAAYRTLAPVSPRHVPI